MSNWADKKPLFLVILFSFLILATIKISWDLGYKEAIRQAQNEKEQEKRIANQVVTKSAELYNLSELKYTTLARETTQCKIPDNTGLNLDNAKDRQMQLLSEIKGLIKQLGIEQDLKSVPGESENL